MKELLWLRQLTEELGEYDGKAIEIFEDNQSCIALANENGYRARSKHIDVRYHAVRERITMKEIKLTYCSTDVMIADIFTKPLPKTKFQKMRSHLSFGNMQADPYDEKFEDQIFSLRGCVEDADHPWRVGEALATIGGTRCRRTSQLEHGAKLCGAQFGPERDAPQTADDSDQWHDFVEHIDDDQSCTCMLDTWV